MDLLVEREKQPSYFQDAIFDDVNFDVDKSLADFESLLDNNDDIFSFLMDPKKDFPLDDEIDSNASSPANSSQIVPDRLVSTDSDSPMEFSIDNMSSSSSSGYSDSSPAPVGDTNLEYIFVTDGVEEIIEDTTIDMGICADVEVLTTDVNSLDDDDDAFSTVNVITEIIPNDIKIELASTLPQLELTEEEKKLLGKEGISLPEYLPLTKAEEKNLKRIRRKIRNKESAQNSRKRKKDYVDGLESRVKMCTTQNIELKKKISHLQGQNQSLITQLRKLQAMVATNTNKPAQMSACALVLMLSFALFLFPSFRTGMDNETQQFPATPASSIRSPFAGNSRSLLYHSPNAPLSVDNKYGIQNANDNYHEPSTSKAVPMAPSTSRFESKYETVEAMKSSALLADDFKELPVIEKTSSAPSATNLSKNAQSRTIVVNAPPHNRNAY